MPASKIPRTRGRAKPAKHPGWSRGNWSEKSKASYITGWRRKQRLVHAEVGPRRTVAPWDDMPFRSWVNVCWVNTAKHWWLSCDPLDHGPSVRHLEPWSQARMVNSCRQAPAFIPWRRKSTYHEDSWRRERAEHNWWIANTSGKAQVSPTSENPIVKIKACDILAD